MYSQSASYRAKIKRGFRTVSRRRYGIGQREEHINFLSRCCDCVWLRRLRYRVRDRPRIEGRGERDLLNERPDCRKFFATIGGKLCTTESAEATISLVKTLLEKQKSKV